ncbi:MAG: CvpA family protein [Desulforhabdus sp.]|jgi:membrane protein required for colicin V production|nr:CvpA family protein [Desulforhabdus sp.]
MNALDWVLLGGCVVCVGRGLWRGAVSQVFGIAGVLGGFLLAAHFYEGLALRLSQAFPKLAAIGAISFGILFLLTWFCIGVIGFWLAQFLHRSGMGFLDRLFGGVVGFGKAVVLGVVIISVLTFFLSPQSSLVLKSYLAPHVQQIARIVIAATPASVQQLFDRKRIEFQSQWAKYQKTSLAAQKQGREGAKDPK